MYNMETLTEKRTYKRRGGATEKPFLEKKVMVFYTVKRRYHNEATKAIRELCKQWR